MGSIEINFQSGQIPETAIQLLQFAEIEKKLLLRATSHFSQKELLTYLSDFQIIESWFGRLLQFSNRLPKEFNQSFYNIYLFHKGYYLQVTQRLSQLVAAADDSTRNVFYAWKGYQRRLGEIYSQVISERKYVDEIEARANELEKQLTYRIAGFTAVRRDVQWQDVQKQLKPNEVALEFIHFKNISSMKDSDSTLYAALILHPGDTTPQFIPLFEEKELTSLLKGATGGNNFLKINALYAQKTANSKQKSLYELIWLPLENALKDNKTVYYAPSGLLHRINLAAISNTNGKTFGENHNLVFLGSTRQLVAPNINTNTSNDAYLAGGIRYDSDSTTLALANRDVQMRGVEGAFTLPFQPDSASATRGGVLEYLPASAAEVREIGQTLHAAGFQAKVDTGFYATEEAFRQLGVGAPAPRILHLATHGYFFPDPVKKDQKLFDGLGQEPVFKMSEHPMIRSGLILAGAKQTWLTGKHPEGQEDGILTAYEISQMNLEGTELVVLSACETGLGDIVGNEGVFGLQRAFKIAGAKYLIMSLWKVDDQSTKDFMTTFYKHWLIDKQTVPEAFQTTQRAMREKRPGAFDWAGFVLVE